MEWRPQPGNTSLRVSCTTVAHPIVQGLPAALSENNPCFCVVFRDYLLYLPQTWSSSPGCGSGLIGNRVQIPDSPAAVKHREIPSICATGPSGREGFGKGVSQKTCQVDSMSKNPGDWVFDFDRVSQKSLNSTLSREPLRNDSRSCRRVISSGGPVFDICWINPKAR